jgi:ubiquinone/menaquinone biosynthesis C-methylase UbiE
LNVGCGWGRELVRFPNAVGVDLCLPYLKTARNYTPHDYILADAEHLPFRPNVFDFLCSSEVIEHIPNPQQAIDEMRRVIVDGGRIVIQTPNANLTQGKVVDESYLHVKEFTKQELIDVLKGKFKIVKVTGSTIPYVPTKNRFYWLNWNPLFLAFWKCLNKLLPFKWDIIICAEK